MLATLVINCNAKLSSTCWKNGLGGCSWLKSSPIQPNRRLIGTPSKNNCRMEGLMNKSEIKLARLTETASQLLTGCITMYAPSANDATIALTAILRSNPERGI